MPRGKKKVVNIAEKIEAVKAEIEALTTQLKEKKAELKKLEAEQAEEDKAKLIEAFTVSGKGIDTRGHGSLCFYREPSPCFWSGHYRSCFVLRLCAIS